jgi:hypothetical protein
MRRGHVAAEHGLDLDLLAEGRAQKPGDIDHGGVDVDIARLQRLLARKGEQALDQLGAALGRLIDQARHVPQVGLIRKLGDERFGGAADDGQHVVEVVRDAAGQLADGVELLRLLQLPLGFACPGDVVIDQRGAADLAGLVAQRAAADDEMDRGVGAEQQQHDLLLGERLASEHARRR